MESTLHHKTIIYKLLNKKIKFIMKRFSFIQRNLVSSQRSLKNDSLLVVSKTTTGYVEEVVHVCTKNVQGAAQKNSNFD